MRCGREGSSRWSGRLESGARGLQRFVARAARGVALAMSQKGRRSLTRKEEACTRKDAALHIKRQAVLGRTAATGAGAPAAGMTDREAGALAGSMADIAAGAPARSMTDRGATQFLLRSAQGPHLNTGPPDDTVQAAAIPPAVPSPMAAPERAAAALLAGRPEAAAATLGTATDSESGGGTAPT